MRTLLTILTFLMFFAVVTPAAEPITDDVLYDQVRIKMANDRTVGGGNIQVKVTNGIVELTGTVKEEKQRSQAEKVAKKVKGVKNVENKLRVAPV
jgi:hyperosmotically inducible periplasmic protein